MTVGFGSGFGGPLAGEPTYRVSQLNEEIRDVLGEVFPGLWVQGEVHRPRASQRGHLYFELVEKGVGDRIVGRIDAVVWRTDHQRVRRDLARSDQELADGQQVRCFGNLDFYPAGGRLQLVVRQVDPMFSLGELERRRRETLRTLEAAGLLETNGDLDLSAVPLRIGLVTSKDSAAYHDFLTGLRVAGYGFQVFFAHAAVQGREAEHQVASALRLLAGVRPRLDAVAVVRGGGSRSDLAAFDSRRIAEAVARCPLPVICGLGHEIDRAIADVVCHTSVKTPTEAATLLVQRVAEADRAVAEAEAGLARAARRVLDQAEGRLRRMDRIAQHGRHALEAGRRQVHAAARSLGLLARRRVRESGDALDHFVELLPSRARRSLDRAAERHADVGERLAHRARGHLRHHASLLDGAERLLHGLAPERLLERGYSITRTTAGDLVTSPDQVRSGDRLTTQLAGGTLHSEAIEPGD